MFYELYKNNCAKETTTVLLKFDFHSHTDQSADAGQSAEQLFNAALAKGLSGLAITNHNTYNNCSRAGLYIIPAAEYSTDVGHLLVYFLNEPLEKTLSRGGRSYYNWQDVVGLAHDKGALVFVAHPFSPDYPRPDEFWKAIDGIEVFNARIIHSRNIDANKRALALSRAGGLPFSCGSDAHFEGEVGCTHWECEIDIEGKTHDEVLQEVRLKLMTSSGRVVPGRASPFYRCASQWVTAWRAGLYKKLLKIPGRFLYGIYTLTLGRRRYDFDVSI